MDVREKYVMQKVNKKEKSICPNCIHHNLCIAENNQPCFECNRFIDAHGVTVQEWISVKDRLPEKYGRYLVLTPGYLKGFDQYDAWLIYYHPESGFYDTDTQWGDIPMDDVTHWMYLPQPPKGE